MGVRSRPRISALSGCRSPCAQCLGDVVLLKRNHDRLGQGQRLRHGASGDKHAQRAAAGQAADFLQQRGGVARSLIQPVQQQKQPSLRLVRPLLRGIQKREERVPRVLHGLRFRIEAQHLKDMIQNKAALSRADSHKRNIHDRRSRRRVTACAMQRRAQKHGGFAHAALAHQQRGRAVFADQLVHPCLRGHGRAVFLLNSKRIQPAFALHIAKRRVLPH